MNAFGTPNQVFPLDLCGWSRGFATRFVYGVGSVGTGSAGGAMADIAHSGCLILWGYNPSSSRITHATGTVEALKRGMKLIVIDPRRAGLTKGGYLAGRPIAYDPATGRYGGPSEQLALAGEYRVATRHGMIPCRPVFDLYTGMCRAWSPEMVEATCWIPQGQLEEAARMIWQSRPVSYYAWSGHEQHANTTQTARAMALLYALTGSFDAPGGKCSTACNSGRTDHRRGSSQRRNYGPSTWRWRTPIGAGAMEVRLRPGFLSSRARGETLCRMWIDGVWPQSSPCPG